MPSFICPQFRQHRIYDPHKVVQDLIFLEQNLREDIRRIPLDSLENYLNILRDLELHIAICRNFGQLKTQCPSFGWLHWFVHAF